MKTIQLTRGLSAVVDDVHFEWLRGFRWHADSGGSGVWYARAYVNGGCNSAVRMHRLILGAPRGIIVDHINGDGLDNRRVNLRIVSHKDNTTAKRKSPGTSRYKGVSWVKCDAKWRAQIAVAGKNRTLGRFDDEGDAARFYDAAARRLHGRFATLNFPLPGELSALARGVSP